MIISLSREFVYVHIHKCAGTSIEMALSQHLAVNDIVIGSTRLGQRLQAMFRQSIGLDKHSTAADARRFLSPEHWPHFFSFAFVRAPVARMHSLYRFALACMARDPLTAEERQRFEQSGALPERRPYTFEAVASAIAANTFSDFILNPFTWDDPGARPQIESLFDDDGQPLVNFIGKVEAIDQDWNTVQERLGIAAPLEHHNVTEYTEMPETTPEAAALLAKRFAADYALLGYPEGR